MGGVRRGEEADTETPGSGPSSVVGVERSRVEAAFAAAHVHPLLCAVAQRTGDLSLLRAELLPDQSQLLVVGRGLGPEQEELARGLAVDARRGRCLGRGGPRTDTQGTAGCLRFLVGDGATA